MSHHPLYQPGYLALRSRLSWKKALGLLFGAGVPLAVAGSTLGAGFGVPSAGPIVNSARTSFVDVDLAARGFGDIVGQHLAVPLPGVPITLRPVPPRSPAPAPDVSGLRPTAGTFLSVSRPAVQPAPSPVPKPAEAAPPVVPTVAAKKERVATTEVAKAAAAEVAKLEQKRVALARQVEIRAKARQKLEQFKQNRDPRQQEPQGMSGRSGSD